MTHKLEIDFMTKSKLCLSGGLFLYSTEQYNKGTQLENAVQCGVFSAGIGHLSLNTQGNLGYLVRNLKYNVVIMLPTNWNMYTLVDIAPRSELKSIKSSNT